MTMSILHNLCCKKVLIFFCAFWVLFYTALTKCKGKLGKKEGTQYTRSLRTVHVQKIAYFLPFLQLTSCLRAKKVQEKRYIALRYVSRSTHKTLWNHKPKEKQQE